MSSSRVQITLTGAPAALDVSRASWMKSSSNRRPIPSAQVRRVDLDLFGRDAADLGAESLRARLELPRSPDVHAASPPLCCAVHRLHRRMGEERQLVYRLDLVGPELNAGLGSPSVCAPAP